MAKEDYFQEADDEITFNIINRDVVDRLRRDGDIVLPEKKVSVSKDERWNTKQMTSKVLKGLENGDSVQSISQSLQEVIGNNEASAIRNARTMVTSAENHGRLDSYKNLSNQGVVMKKEWQATPDDRTRPSHIDIDGEEQDIDKVFSNGCQFPGDARGPAEEVWMCRCAMGTHIIGFKRADGTVSEVNYQRDETLHDEQMAELKKANAKGQAPKIDADTEQRYYEFKDDADEKKIYHLEVKDLERPLTENEIIEKIMGGDKTKGSCASVAIAYCGNKAGLDVTDFRDGKSRELFSEDFSKVFKVANAKVTTYKVKKEMQEVAQIVQNIEIDKQFVLSTGKHMAIIKRESEKGLQYLELQEEMEVKYAWQPFGKNTEQIEKTLNIRFGCRKTIEKSSFTGKTLERNVWLAEVDSFEKTDEFRDVLGYMNTATDKQKKGIGGYAR